MKKRLSILSVAAAAWGTAASVEAGNPAVYIICLAYMIFWLFVNSRPRRGSGRKRPQLYDLKTQKKIAEEVRLIHARELERRADERTA